MEPVVDRAIDALVEAVREEQHLPGVAVAVVRNGQVEKATGYGLASLELRVPVVPETVFCIGSLTKQFTATAIMQLLQAGAFALDDAVVPFIQPLINLPLPDGWGAITLRRLLTHTSGLKRDAVNFRPTENTLPPDYIPVLYRWGRQEFTPEDLVRQLAALPLDFAPPGSRMSYSNAGYYLLGLVIERTSGLSYADYLARYLTGPLGMTATRLVSDDVIAGLATGYTWEPGESGGQGQWRRGGYVNPSRDHAAGSLVSTLGDLARWDRAWYSDAVLPQVCRDQMWTEAALPDGTGLGYGLGWVVGEMPRTSEGAPPYRFVGHSGMWGGFTAHWVRFPDECLTVITLTNLGISGRCVNGGVSGNPAVLSRRVAGLLLPDLLL